MVWKVAALPVAIVLPGLPVLPGLGFFLPPVRSGAANLERKPFDRTGAGKGGAGRGADGRSVTCAAVVVPAADKPGAAGVPRLAAGPAGLGCAGAAA